MLPIRYLIVEDEHLAYLELKRMVSQLRPTYTLAGHTGTVEGSAAFLQANQLDLILMDIHLADGDSFEIFNRVSVTTPIIFTTAFDEHAIRAFKQNSIDYLLKPIGEDELEAALRKFEQLRLSSHTMIDSKKLEELFGQRVKNRFLIQKGDSFGYIEASEAAFFYSEDKVVFLHTFTNKRYVVDYTLDQLEKQLDGSLFFRASRNCIPNIKAIQRVSKYFNSRLKVTLNPECPHEVLVSRVRVPEFLQWLDGIS